jgi:hypothetical protein
LERWCIHLEAIGEGGEVVILLHGFLIFVY